MPLLIGYCSTVSLSYTCVVLNSYESPSASKESKEQSKQWDFGGESALLVTLCANKVIVDYFDNTRIWRRNSLPSRQCTRTHLLRCHANFTQFFFLVKARYLSYNPHSKIHSLKMRLVTKFWHILGNLLNKIFCIGRETNLGRPLAIPCRPSPLLLCL